MISFTIIGKPRPLMRHRPSARGGYYDPSSKVKKQTWLQIAKYKPKKPYTGHIIVELKFYMQRPKHHYRTGKYSHILKDCYKKCSCHCGTPDLDNLIKYILDVMNKGFYVDDKQVCKIQASKGYGDPARTVVIIEEIL